MARAGKGVQFGSPMRGKDAASRPPRGRTCEHPGCTTVLSTYNSASRCWAHEPRTYPGASQRN
jgi:hypothetical protein